MKQKTIILIGRSGCGKGAQAKLISERLKKMSLAGAGGDQGAAMDVLYIQSGVEFREFIKGDSLTAKLSAKMYAEGTLQPEFLAVNMWVSALVRDYQGNQHVIFDGTPRKVHEAGVLDSVFDFYKMEKPLVINIDVSRKIVTERLLERHRQDDIRGDIESRMNWYETEVVPTIAFYKKNPKYSFIRINGEQTIEQVFTEIIEKAGI